MSREVFGSAQTRDKKAISLLRYEYNTVRKDHGLGDVGAIDFVLLQSNFVSGNYFLTVVNKGDTLRKRLRSKLGRVFSPAIDCAIEFKMVHTSDCEPVRFSAFDYVLAKGPNSILKDCRKLAKERVRIAYSVAFSHPISDNKCSPKYVEELFQNCVGE